MSDGPISFTDANVRQLRAGNKTQTRRPGTRLMAYKPGDRLWVREPFRLIKRFDNIAPLQALRLHAEVASWPVDEPVDHALASDIGRRRYAREMPRALHRMHLVLRGIRSERLQAISDTDASAEGVAHVAAYAALWDTLHAGGKTIAGTPVRWAQNPIVTVLEFDVVDCPLDGARNPQQQAGDQR